MPTPRLENDAERAREVEWFFRGPGAASTGVIPRQSSQVSSRERNFRTWLNNLYRERVDLENGSPARTVGPLTAESMRTVGRLSVERYGGPAANRWRLTDANPLAEPARRVWARERRAQAGQHNAPGPPQAGPRNEPPAAAPPRRPEAAAAHPYQPAPAAAPPLIPQPLPSIGQMTAGIGAYGTDPHAPQPPPRLPSIGQMDAGMRADGTGPHAPQPPPHLPSIGQMDAGMRADGTDARAPQPPPHLPSIGQMDAGMRADGTDPRAPQPPPHLPSIGQMDAGIGADGNPLGGAVGRHLPPNAPTAGAPPQPGDGAHRGRPPATHTQGQQGGRGRSLGGSR
ncbi:hypothetical protein GCM10009863_43440 [Streptomyces axinellae]|uniref:Uncharacterized protein n=1 Tax=Streptomyces axinellae TaxID=552788 RepID=A0ABN3QED9_9ACTN